MKNPLKILSWLVLVLFLVTGCKNEKSASIVIRSATQPNAGIKVSTSAHHNNKTLFETKTDSIGNSAFELALAKPRFVYIKIGNTYGELYVSPGDELVIDEDQEKSSVPFNYSGKGAEVNNYLAWVNATANKIKMAGKIPMPDMTDAQFLIRFDSLKNTINNFHQKYTDSVNLSSDDEKMLLNKNRIKFLQLSQEYKFYRMNSAMMAKKDAQSAGETFLEAKISPELENLTNEVPLTPALLTDGYGDYQMLLNFYWQNEIRGPVTERILFGNAPEDSAPLLTDSLIERANYPDEIREFLKSFNLNYWLSMNGITPETDSVFTAFKRKHATSPYLPIVKKQYDEWLAVTPGKPIPDLTGFTTDGKIVSIKDLRGKVVYIDVWATWCAPCIAEIPASKKLQQELIKEKDLQFITISVDYERSNWEKFLAKQSDWGGLHLIVAPEKMQSFYSNYKLAYVPAYIIIDRAGNIVTMKAPRPSDDQTKLKLKKILSQGI